MDIKIIFLDKGLDKKIYIEQPKRLKRKKNWAYKSRKSEYYWEQVYYSSFIYW